MEAKELGDNLGKFIESAWHIVEPVVLYIPNWHIDCIVDHLEAVSRQEIKRLMINIPPRHMKSLAVSVFWPVWVWINNPAFRWLFSSYDKALSTRDSVKCRRIIQSPWFQKRWGDIFSLTSDQNVKTRFENDATGYRIATSVGGAGTGEGGDGIVIDDPHNTETVFSDTIRESAISWHDNLWFNRLNDENTGVKVYVGQRSHHKDLFGHILLNEGGYTHLCLPMEYEGKNRIVTSLDWVDPRTEPKELLYAERFPQEVVDKIKKKGSYIFAGQYQQNPAPLEGGLINIEWFRAYQQLPPRDCWIRIIQAWDTAQKPDEVINDPWVGGTWLESNLPNGGIGYFLLDVCRKWMNYPTGKKEVIRQAAKWMPSTIIIEDKSTGSSLLQELPLIKDWRIPLHPFLPETDKLTRMSVESPAIESGMVFLPDNEIVISDEVRNTLIRTDWIADSMIEASTFPNSETKDFIDMLSMSLKFFRENAFIRQNTLLAFIGDEIYM